MKTRLFKVLNFITKFKLLFLFLFLFIIIFLYISKVNNNLTDEDKKYISYFLIDIKIPSKDKTFQDEILFVKAVQDSVLKNSLMGKIPKSSTREPRDLFISKTGQCPSRSRVIEKILRFSGFKTRHVSMYSKVQTNSFIKTLLTPGIPSHAVTEVLTLKGWMVVEPNEQWIAVDKKDNILSIYDIYLQIEKNNKIKWKNEPPLIYNEKFIYVYGLYSRHGQFYPPYNFIPDIEWNEFLFNIIEIFNERK